QLPQQQDSAWVGFTLGLQGQFGDYRDDATHGTGLAVGGPYADMAPELLIGYHKGFRHSWDCATGAVPKDIFTDNTKSWSGDHCVDPRLVPGVFWCNREIATETPNLMDIAPTALDLFGVDIPRYMQGKPLFETGSPAAEERTHAGSARAAAFEAEKS
ncbi:MAG: hypothetical protein AAF368_07805, partial [Planctomycetota bacterium]